MDYRKFIEARRFTDFKSGFVVDDSWLNAGLKQHQRYIVKWALAKGRAAVFADTGLGKSRVMSEWGLHVAAQTGGRVIFLSPLAVAHQTIKEAAHVGVDLHYRRHDTGEMFIITNYEMAHNFDMSQFSGVVLDESSILKNFDGKMRQLLSSAVQTVPYRLSCSATPSPNDHMELGTQSEFLGVMSRAEMLGMFFQHDGKNSSQWALKGHGRRRFWEWMSTWAVCIRTPEDLGLDGTEYILPPLKIHYHELPTDYPIANTLTERRGAKNASMVERVAVASLLVNSSRDTWVVWCHRNAESEQLTVLIPDAVEVTGSMPVDDKERRLMEFGAGQHRVLVTKPSIAGFGMNWQHCSNVVFVGLTDSFEEFYQTIRRCYRFGQTKNVTVHCFLSSAEIRVIENLNRKEKQHHELSAELLQYMKAHMVSQVVGTHREYTEYTPTQNVIIPELIKENIEYAML